MPQIEVTFDIDVDGILSVKAREKETGVEQSVTIQGASNLSENEIDEMLKEAEKFASLDKEKRQSIDLKNQAEALCFEAEKELISLKESISEEKQEYLKKSIEDIRQSIENGDESSIETKVENLKNAMKEIMADKINEQSNSDPMSNLNDL